MPAPEIAARRVGTLYQAATGEGFRVVIAPVQALLRRTLPPEVLLAEVEYVAAGEEADRDGLTAWLVARGYQRTRLVQAPGEFSVRGSLLDLFPPLHDRPIRLDFFGDQVEEIRAFDPLTQRTLHHLPEAVILPAAEVFLPGCREADLQAVQDRVVRVAGDRGWPARKVHELLQRIESCRLAEGSEILLPLLHPDPPPPLAYLPPGTPVLLDEPEAVAAAAEAFWERASRNHDLAAAEHRVLSDLEALFLSPAQLHRALEASPRWRLSGLGPRSREDGVIEIRSRLPEPPAPPPAGAAADPAGPAFDRLRSWIEAGDRVVLVTPGERQRQRLARLLAHHGLSPAPETAEVVPAAPGLHLRSGPLTCGFMLPGEALVVLTEDELLGGRRPRRARRRAEAGGETLAFEDLRPGEYVVHRDHGIARFQGLVHLEAGGVPGEYLLLEFRDEDKLYLPVDRLALIQKYVGVEGREPRLDRLGGTRWPAARGRVRKAVREIAHELVELYAARRVRSGTAFSPPDTLFRQFEAAFPYEETPHQAAAIEDVLSDMTSERPMDRLVCGDVGYGKTEVALRAVMKAVVDGRQAAVLVPTTLLAEQHERTFRDRFRAFPVKVGALSRLKPPAEQRRVLAGVASGEIDVVIGTHRLLQPDVRFADLGLVVIDEEHRFGVRHKERLKRLRETVDCLTLTATPIPRTLQLSFLGLRDLSVIDTPPRDRLPVKTFLAEADDAVLREALTRELDRGGQVYFVHNRIQGLERLAEHLGRLVPGARIRTAHGRMPATQLEDIMLAFLKGEIDCLVCTTIIESGIDIPSANTIVINRADRIGLADLYQLRGRVGRAREQAYAYLLVPRLGDLAPEARKRLRAIMELSELGGGYRLAMRDLQIRGAGNILGVSQSGHVAEVGYEMFLELLQQAVEEIRGEPAGERIDPEVHLPVPAFIPEDYVPDVEQRLALYRRMARLADEADFADLADELEDRFGAPPPEVTAMLRVMALKRDLAARNVARLDCTEPRDRATRQRWSHQLVLAFTPAGPPDPDGLLRRVRSDASLRPLPDGRLKVFFRPAPGEDLLAAAARALQAVPEKAT
nr:transcription-repair coupling factor [Dissulfurirhabdus thermomarina]